MLHDRAAMPVLIFALPSGCGVGKSTEWHLLSRFSLYLALRPVQPCGEYSIPIIKC
jgi:hypothetical protein